LADVVGADGVVTDGDELAHFGSDRCRGGWPVDPAMIVFARSASHVQGVVRACAAHGVAIVPSGGRTGLSGAATATQGEVVLSLQRMGRVLDIDEVARTLRCEAGTIVQTVQETAASVGLLYPVAFAAQGSAVVGGTIATNAGGLRVVRYGHTRDWVMGLSVVLASGELVELGGQLFKNNTGYDLRQLFIGSEGTLGVIVEATLRLCEPPRGTVSALCAVPDDSTVLAVFTRARRHGLTLQAFECFDRRCLEHVQEHRGRERIGPFSAPSPQHALIEVEVTGYGPDAEDHARDELTTCLASAQDAGEITDAVIAATRQQSVQLWSLREDITESLHRYTPFKSDVALPLARVTAFLEAFRARVAEALPDIETVVFGHVGDGNLHLNILRPEAMELDEFVRRCAGFADEMYAMVRAHGGSISAEHGIGLLKRPYLHYSRSPEEIAMMRAVKRAIDPDGLFNPGKIFEP
jgi:FAD/FMN-containing dehydrogenase